MHGDTGPAGVVGNACQPACAVSVRQSEEDTRKVEKLACTRSNPIYGQ